MGSACVLIAFLLRNSCLGPYPYRRDLMHLDSMHSPYPPAPELMGGLPPLTPFIHQWEFLLSSHHDAQFVSYILDGLKWGFRLGFSWSNPLNSTEKNNPSSREHGDAIDEYLQKEMRAGNLVGPISSRVLTNGQHLHVNRIGVVPKGYNTGKWRVITDLSFPRGQSVNDGINAQWCSLEYTTVDKIAMVVAQLGRGALLAKVDIKSAYRLVPVNLADRSLLGITWRDKYYVDTRLPFGLRSAPKIFNALADALEWCFRRQGVTDVDHYLDDFITIGPPHSAACAQNLQLIKDVSACLGVPLAEDKCEGPSTSITFLGIQVDTEQGTLSLPADKLSRIQKELEAWRDRKWCRRRMLESLIGLLHHAARVVRPGRSFLRRLINLLQGTRHNNHFIRLNKEARADIHWWMVFVGTWNGISFYPGSAPSVYVTSDASGSWGCGAFSGSEWFHLQWPEVVQGEDITFKELLPIVLAVTTWGSRWRGMHVHCRCDNEAVVHVMNSRRARNHALMHLLRCLFYFEAHYNLHLSASHISGTLNLLADDLSRNHLSSFFLQAPYMARMPVPLPLFAMDLLLDQDLDWSSPAWIGLLRAFVH